MPAFVWIIIASGAGILGGYFIFRYFRKEWTPYLDLTKQSINLVKFIINAFDKDPESLSVQELFIDILERSFNVIEDIVNNQDVIAGMTLEGQISYIRAKVETTVDEYLTDHNIILDENKQNAINTVMNIVDFFLKLLLPKLSQEIKP